MAVVRITGIFHAEDPRDNVEFQITREHGWQQWGNRTEKLGATSPLVEALTEAAYDHLEDPED